MNRMEVVIKADMQGMMAEGAVSGDRLSSVREDWESRLGEASMSIISGAALAASPIGRRLIAVIQEDMESREQRLSKLYAMMQPYGLTWEQTEMVIDGQAAVSDLVDLPTVVKIGFESRLVRLRVHRRAFYRYAPHRFLGD